MTTPRLVLAPSDDIARASGVPVASSRKGWLPRATPHDAQPPVPGRRMRDPEGDLRPCPSHQLTGLAESMFVTGEFTVDLSLPIAQASLVKAACGGSLGRASQGAYGDGLADLIRSGHAGAAMGMPELAEVRCRELVAHGESAVLTVRWEACLPGGTLFPALDADITLVPVGGDATRFWLAGVYRPPPAWPSAGPGRGMWRRVAAATIQYFLAGLPAVLAAADDGDPRRGAGGPGGPEIVDGLVQFPGGALDLAP